MTQETSGPRVESKVQIYLNSVKRTSEDRKEKVYLYNEMNKNRFFFTLVLSLLVLAEY